MARPEKKERNELIYKLHKKKNSYATIAKMFEVNKWRIGQIVRAQREKATQKREG